MITRRTKRSCDRWWAIHERWPERHATSSAHDTAQAATVCSMLLRDVATLSNAIIARLRMLAARVSLESSIHRITVTRGFHSPPSRIAHSPTTTAASGASTMSAACRSARPPPPSWR